MGKTNIKIPEIVRPIAKLAREAGWSISLDGAGHLTWTSPTGERVHSASTPGDFRSVRSLRSDLRHKGLDVPSPGYTPPKRLTAIEVRLPMTSIEDSLTRAKYGEQAKEILDGMLFPPTPAKESEPEMTAATEVPVRPVPDPYDDEYNIKRWRAGTGPKDPSNPPPTWSPRFAVDSEPWKCTVCDHRTTTRFKLSGHMCGHSARSIESRAAIAAAEAEHEAKSHGDAIKGAVREVLLEMLAISESGGGDNRDDMTAKARIELERELELRTAQRDRLDENIQVADRERDEAVAALTLLLTDYINPRLVAGVIDVAKYISLPEPSDPIV